MVANNSLGLLKSVITLPEFFVLDSSSASLSLGEREKYATSEPEIKAEHTKRTTKTSSTIIKVIESALKIIV